MAYRKVCEQLALKVGTSENGGSHMLKRMNIEYLTQKQKKRLKRLFKSIRLFYLYSGLTNTNMGN